MAVTKIHAVCTTMFIIANFYNLEAFIVTPVDTLVLQGDSTQLNCNFDSLLAFKSWYRNLTIISIGSDVFDDYGDYELIIEGDAYNLRVHNVTSKDEEEYECRDLSGTTGGSNANIYVIDSLPQCLSNPAETLIEGDNILFECVIDINENAPGHLVWLKDGQEVSRKEGHQHIWETQLSRSDNNAIYDCQLQHHTLPPWKWSMVSCEDTFQIDVQYAPDVYIVYASQNPMREEERFSAECEPIDANPDNIVHAYWVGNEGEKVSNGTSLLLVNVTRHMHGEYTCVMSNIFYNGVKGNGTASIVVDVQYLSSINMTITPFANITEGDEVTINCEALDGNPDPHLLELLFQDKVIDQSDELLLHHTIPSIEGSHSGIYQCNSYTLFYDGEEERSSFTRDIAVYYSPKFVSDEFKYEANMDDTVPMSCEVHGFPTPAITWYDQNSDLILGEEQNMKIIEQSNGESLVKSTLTVTVADESYYGTYTCKASNNIPPDDEQTMEIVKPGSNSEIIAISVTCTVIVVVLIVGIVLGILFYKRRVAKNQSNNTDYVNAGLDTSDYAEIPAINLSHRQEPEGLSEAIDLQETTNEKFHPKSPQHVGGQNVTLSQMTKAAPQTSYYEVDLSSIGGPAQKSQSQSTNTEQMQYASLQLTQPSEYQSLK